MYKTIIVSNTAQLPALKQLVADSTSLQLIGETHTITAAIGLIVRQEPDLVFIEIDLSDGVGFEILEKLPNRNFEVVFVSNSDKHALRAFEFSALQYLLLPLQEKDFEQVLKRMAVVKQIPASTNEKTNNPEIIVLPTLEGFMVIKINEIVRCEADDNYTRIFLLNKKALVVSKSLAQYEKLLFDLHFARIHHKHLVNLYYIKKYVKGRGGYVILNDETALDVSARKKEDFLAKLKAFSRQT